MKNLYQIINIFIGLVWFVNGLYCKVLNQVPRHQEIVSSVLSEDYARELTLIIGLLEIGMAFLVWSKFKSRIISILQILGILFMNIIEFTLTQNLLLWGKWNFVFALIFIAIIYFNEFIFKKSIK